VNAFRPHRIPSLFLVTRRIVRRDAMPPRAWAVGAQWALDGCDQEAVGGRPDLPRRRAVPPPRPPVPAVAPGQRERLPGLEPDRSAAAEPRPRNPRLPGHRPAG